MILAVERLFGGDLTLGPQEKYIQSSAENIINYFLKQKCNEVALFLKIMFIACNLL
jgi:hypothetical protein